MWWKRNGIRASASVSSEFVAGNVDPMVMLICGYFRATYGSSIDLFAGLSTPIVDHFEPANELGAKLQAALAEISGRQVGMQAMTTAISNQGDLKNGLAGTFALAHKRLGGGDESRRGREGKQAQSESVLMMQLHDCGPSSVSLFEPEDGHRANPSCGGFRR